MPLGLFSRGGGSSKKNKEEDDWDSKRLVVVNDNNHSKDGSNKPIKPLTTWREAHRETCLSQSTLCPSLQQVVDNGYENLSDHPDSGRVLLWGERQHALQEILQKFQTQTIVTASAATQPTKSTTKSTTTSVFSRAANLAMMPFDLLTSPFVAAHDDDYGDVPPLDDDEIDEDTPPTPLDRTTNSATASTTTMVGENEAILQVDLTLECLNYIKALVHRGPAQILKLDPNNNNSTSESSFQHWIREHSSAVAGTAAAQLVPQLPNDQISFLLDVLVAAGVVQKICRQADLGKPDLLVLPDSSNATVDVRLALFDLQEAVDHLHERVHALEARSKAALTAAKVCKQQGNTQGAIYQIQRKKQIQHEIDITYKHLTNLETQQQALRQAADTHRMQKAMEQTAETLKTIRLSKQAAAAAKVSTTTGQPMTTQDLMDDLAEELERVEDGNLALAMPTVVMDDLDEEALLQELADYPDPDPDDDIDVDELLEEMSCLEVSTAAPQKPKTAVATTKPPAAAKHKPLQLPLPPSAAGTVPASIYDGGNSKPTTTANKKGKDDESSSKRKLASAVCL